MMRTDFPWDLYTRPLAIQVAAKLTACPAFVGCRLYLFFESDGTDYWIMNADKDLLTAVAANLALPFWDEVRETKFWFNLVATIQARETGMDYKTVRTWYPAGTE